MMAPVPKMSVQWLGTSNTVTWRNQSPGRALTILLRCTVAPYLQYIGSDYLKTPDHHDLAGSDPAHCLGHQDATHDSHLRKCMLSIVTIRNGKRQFAKASKHDSNQGHHEAYHPLSGTPALRGEHKRKVLAKTLFKLAMLAFTWNSGFESRANTPMTATTWPPIPNLC